MTDVEGVGPPTGAIDALDADALIALLHRTRDAFAVHRQEIDSLNVFPVPDGDTGTNLLMTVDGVLEEMGADPEDVPREVTRGAMRSARGNSGVILSQVLRALAEGISQRGGLDGGGLSEALGRARAYVYDAVADPVEGTMLTAVTAASEAAHDARGDGLPEVTERVADAVGAAVRETTGQLKVLEDAGVVDAGARGFEVFCLELQGLAAGTPAHHVPAPVVRRYGTTARYREAGSDAYRYEVQYLLDAGEADAPMLRERLVDLGDSVTVVAAEDLMNVHVHTNEIGAAIEAGLDLGRPSRIQVVRFTDQIAERERAAASEGAVTEIGAVAVVPGEGLAELVDELGAAPVLGGPGELPSVAEILNAVGAVAARRIAILPGHPNVVPAAHQAVDVAVAEGGRPLDVLDRVDSAPAVLSALAVLAPDGDPDRVLDEMTVAAAACRHTEVVPAIRNADTPIGPVRRGQHLGIHGGQVLVAADDPIEALRETATAAGVEDAELAILIAGAAVDEDERGRARRMLLELAPELAIEVVDGGQRSARYLLGLE